MGSALTCLVGLAMVVLVAPLATAGLASIERAAVRRLLGPPAHDKLTARVGALRDEPCGGRRRAETERRRIDATCTTESSSGSSRSRWNSVGRVSGSPQILWRGDARRRRARMRKAALSELREVARGVHPAILTDRGLDAALSSVVARCPIPVELSVEVADATASPDRARPTSSSPKR